MQVHLRYHRDKFAKGDPFNPYSNIFTGASILKDCMVRVKNNSIKSFRCYNGGGDSKYSSKVLKVYSEIKQLEII
jgi:soluble lytic murein transglycosylase-like protein